MNLPIETDLEEDGRWIAAVPSMPGVYVYGITKEEALQRVQALALRVIADRLENGELSPGPTSVTFVAA
jgi:predicted RNase H-like HicB family nuclease